MMNPTHPKFAARLALLLLAAIALAPAAACNRDAKKRIKERAEKELAMEKEVAPLRRGLEPNERVIFEFDSDGLWHPSPYTAYHGEQIKVVPTGDAERLGPLVIEMRLGTRKMILGNNPEFAVSTSGSLYFRVTPDRAGPMKDRKFAVSITRTK